MRERRGLGAPVPYVEAVVTPRDARTRTTAVGEIVPAQVGGGLALVVGLQTWPLVGTRLILGRAGGEVGADVEIEDASLSRRHAELVATGTAWVVRDMGSTNGTRVGDRRLAAGEAVAVGADVAIRFGGVGAELKHGNGRTKCPLR